MKSTTILPDYSQGVNHTLVQYIHIVPGVPVNNEDFFQ